MAYNAGSLTAGVKGLLDLLSELVPVPVPHGRVLQVLDERHRPLEGLDPTPQVPTDGPVRFVLGGREGGREREGGRDMLVCFYLATHSPTNLELSGYFG